MSATVSSALPTPYVPPQPGNGVDAAAPDPATAALQAARAEPGYAENMGRFQTLAGSILDTSKSESSRVDAYQALHKMAVTGDLRGMTKEDQKLYEQAMVSSDLSQRSIQLQNAHIASINAAAQSGGAGAALKTAMSAFDGLSNSDQNLLFKAGLNAPDRTGSTPYGSVQGYRDNLSAQLQLFTYMNDSGAIARGSVPDPKSASGKLSDPKFGAALKLSQIKDNNSASWTAQVIKLFGAGAVKDKVDLSANAQQAIGVRAPVTGATSQSYRQGSIASTVA